MRVLKTDTIELILLHEGSPQRYAILSHTWGKDEVIFEDFITGDPKIKPSYAKVQAACQQAAKDGYDYIWIDNCCIDKSSSAELSEAINSMYVWYKKSDVCYAYLADVHAVPDLKPRDKEFRECLKRSRWFTRGWTLQELLAPERIVFFSKDWTFMGTKHELQSVLSDVTGIDEDILERPWKLHSASIAQRMSWAANRYTTRAEDVAYCLMGLFSVSMPLLYGEGLPKAYLRLQEEIMKQSDDQSLFAWTLGTGTASSRHGLLADHPIAFRNSSKVIPYEDYAPRQPFQMTNRGLSIEVPLSRWDGDIWIAALDCPVPPDYPDSTFLAIYLIRLSQDSDLFTRTYPDRLTQTNEPGDRC